MATGSSGPQASRPKGHGAGEGGSKLEEPCACQLLGAWLAMLAKAAKLVSKQATQRQPGPSGRHHSLASASVPHLSTQPLSWARGSSNLHTLSHFPEAPALPRGHLPGPSFPDTGSPSLWSSNRNRKPAEIPTVRHAHWASGGWGTTGQGLLCALRTTLTQATLPTDEDLIQWP